MDCLDRTACPHKVGALLHEPQGGANMMPAPTDDARDDAGIAKVKLCAKIKVKGEHIETKNSQTGANSTRATV